MPTTHKGEKMTVTRWYDRATRSWVVQRKDAAGNQIGDAYYAGVKSDAVKCEREWKASK